MDGDKTHDETVPMIQFNRQISNDYMTTAPSSPTLSQKSISITNHKQQSQAISIDVSSEVPLVEKTVTQEQNCTLPGPDDILDMLPDAMKIPLDTTNGGNGNGNDQNIEAAKKESGSEDAPEGFNRYRNEKSFSQGLWNITLLMGNLFQLRSVLNNPREPSFNFYFIITLVVLSIVLQITVGLVLIISARYNVNKEDERKTIYTMGTYVLVFAFIVTILNIIIEVFYINDNSAGTKPDSNDSKSL